MFEAKNVDLTDRLQEAIGCKRQSCRTYASQITRLWTSMNPDKPMPKNLKWLDSEKVLNYISKIVNLVKKKNLLVGVLSGMRLLESPRKREKTKKMLMEADANYNSFLTSGKKPIRFKNPTKTWEKILRMPDVIRKVANAHGVLQKGERATHPEYNIAQQLLFSLFVTSSPPRRLDYRHLRLITPSDYANLDKDVLNSSNWIVMGRGVWKWETLRFKTRDSHGPISTTLPQRIKKYLQRMKHMTLAKNSNGYIFLTRKWKPMAASTFSSFVQSMFKTYLGLNKVGMNQIRSLYVSQFYKDAPQSIKMLEISRQMGTSIPTQLKHYRISVPTKDEDPPQTQG